MYLRQPNVGLACNPESKRRTLRVDPVGPTNFFPWKHNSHVTTIQVSLIPSSVNGLEPFRRRQVKLPQCEYSFSGRDPIRRTAQVGTDVNPCPWSGRDILDNARESASRLQALV